MSHHSGRLGLDGALEHGAGEVGVGGLHALCCAARVFHGACEVKDAVGAMDVVGDGVGVVEVADGVADAGGGVVWQLAAEDLDRGLLLQELLHHVGAEEARATCG